MFRIHLLIAFAFITTLSQSHCAAEESQEPITLLGMLSEWQYPDSNFHGATSGDGAVTGIGSIKSRAILSTEDSVEDVVSFYRDQLNVKKDGAPVGDGGDERITAERAVVIQDNSREGILQLVIITIREEKRSTTLAISRGKGESQTNIAWSQFRQLFP